MVGVQHPGLGLPPVACHVHGISTGRFGHSHLGGKVTYFSLNQLRGEGRAQRHSHLQPKEAEAQEGTETISKLSVLHLPASHFGYTIWTSRKDQPANSFTIGFNFHVRQSQRQWKRTVLPVSSMVVLDLHTGIHFVFYSYIEIQLSYNKLHIFKIARLGESWHVYTPTVETVMTYPTTPQSFLGLFIIFLIPLHTPILHTHRQPLPSVALMAPSIALK